MLVILRENYKSDNGIGVISLRLASLGLYAKTVEEETGNSDATKIDPSKKKHTLHWRWFLKCSLFFLSAGIVLVSSYG